MSRRAALALISSAGGSLARAAAPKRILILGGTGFLGPATVAAAQARGHRLTLFNRGKTRPGLFPNIEQLHGDRDPDKGEGIRALAGRQWDAVIDNSGFFPRAVGASAKLLAPNVKQYIYISSISVYADNSKEGAGENAKVATIADPTVEDIGNGNYGALKALCEQAAEKAMPGRVAAVRPGFIVGPDDPSGRFTYWPVRTDRGGEMLVPGEPADPVQFIDVRDLGAWLIRLVEDGTTGVFNATGPEKRFSMRELMGCCRHASSAEVRQIWVPVEFVEERKLEFPIWVPYRGETRGFHTWNIARALRAGLRFRPADETVRDTLAWYKSESASDRRKLAGPTPDQESAALAAWHNM